MKQITFYLDFISPYAYLAFERLPAALEGLSYNVHYKPVLLGALVRQLGGKAPAEIPPKRQWTYRHVLWLGQSLGVPLQMPAAHPYNPLAHLRLALATSGDGEVSRYVAETIFREVWRGGADAIDPARLAALTALLAPAREVNGDAVKAQLKANTAEAAAAGAFGAPTFVADGRLFWGLDSLPMLRASLQGDAWFDSADWAEAAQRPSALPG